MLPVATRQRLIDAIWSEPELYGCEIGFYGNLVCSCMSPGIASSPNYSRVFVVVEQTTSFPGTTADAQQSLPATPTTTTEVPEFVANNSRLTSELVGAGLSCGFAVISLGGMVMGAAAEVPTAGGSTVLVVLSWVGFVTSGIQCINGVARSVEAYKNPDSNSLQQWDGDPLYSTLMLIVDAIGVVTAVVALPAVGRNLFAVLQRRGRLPSLEALKAMSRTERKEAMLKALGEASLTPEGRAEVHAALLKAGYTEHQVSQSLKYGVGGARRASITLGTINRVTGGRLKTQLWGALAGGASPVVSALDSRYIGSGSGCMNLLIVHVLNRVPDSPRPIRDPEVVIPPRPFPG